MNTRSHVNKSEINVLVVGAGPTGLTVANILAQAGVDFRLIDKKAGPTNESRAVVIQPRTVEYWDKIGLAKSALDEGQTATDVNLLVEGQPSGKLVLGGLQETRTPYPFELVLEQNKTERLLIEGLEEAGGQVEWKTELLELHHSDEGAMVVLGHPDGSKETVAVGWVVAADGAHSPVRNALGLRFGGRTYDHGFFLADVDIEWPFGHGDLYIDVVKNGFFAFFPMRGERRYRLLGKLTPELWAKHDRGEQLNLDDIRAVLEQKNSGVGATLESSRWISTYRVHSRMTERFRSGRVFLAGDAAHIHSPAASQGMNTGIGDAFNLTWKLASVVKGEARPELLTSYEAERMPVARYVLDLTDKIFTLQTTENRLMQLFRMNLLPHLLNLTTRSQRVNRFVFGGISQIRTGYRGSPAVGGSAGNGAVRPGDRAPHGLFEDGSSLYKLLRGTGHHLLLFEGLREDPAGLEATREAIEGLLDRYAAPVSVHPIPTENRELHKRYAAKTSSLFLVRPDGHIAYQGSATDIASLKMYLDRLFTRRGTQERTLSVPDQKQTA